MVFKQCTIGSFLFSFIYNAKTPTMIQPFMMKHLATVGRKTDWNWAQGGPAVCHDRLGGETKKRREPEFNTN